MKRLAKDIVVAISLTLLLALPVFLNRAQGADPTVISIDPPSLAVEIGSTFSVDCDVESFFDVQWFSVRLTYDTSKMDAFSVDAYPPFMVTNRIIDDAAGFVLVEGTGGPVSGIIHLVHFDFHCTGSGESSLVIAEQYLFDPMHNPIPVDIVQNGLVTQKSWYLKPPYPDYAPSGVPDFDEKQVGWGPNPGTYTWCGPVAAANSLWWLDSEYESIFNPAPIPPPVISDAFPLVLSCNPQVWDDHDPQNVDPLVRNLAFLMDTDGQQSGDGHLGTRFQDMINGIQNYLLIQGVASMFEVHSQIFPDFYWIESEIEKCQDVVLFLEFYQLTPGGWIKLYDNPSLEFGHCVTSAGVNSSLTELLVSDPWQDAFEAGTAPKGGRSPVWHPFPHATPVHNDAQFVSQDAYQTVQWMFPPPPPLPPPGYPPMVWELSQYLQTMGYPPTYHAFITGAVVTSPTSVPDVAVTVVDPSKNYLGKACPHTPVGFCSNISVTVANQGALAETFDVTLYANATQIGLQTVNNLAAGSVQILTFTWNSSGFVMGNYTIRTDAETLPGEIDTADNTLIDGIVKIGVPCDITGQVPSVADGKCDMRDIGYFAGKFGTTPLSQGWDPNADVTGQTTGKPDDSVNMRDIGEACKHFGERE